MLLFRKEWRILISISSLSVKLRIWIIKINIQRELRPHKIIIQLQIGLEIALFFKCISYV